MIIGFNGHPEFGHDSGVAAIIDGKVSAVYEEERFSRQKKGRKSLPVAALRALASTVGDSKVEAICYAGNPLHWNEDPEDYRRLVSQALRASGLLGRLEQAPPLHFVDHHLAHAYSGFVYLPEQRRNEPTLHLVLDGRGEICSGAAYRSHGSQIAPIWHLPILDSMGLQYEAITQAIGFSWGHEGKTMGLASYGAFDDVLAQAVSRKSSGMLLTADELTEHRADRGAIKAAFNATRAGRKQELAAQLFAPRDTFIRRAAVAAAGQAWLEQEVLEILQGLLRENPGVRNVVMSGGVALNCTANSKVQAVLDDAGIELFVPPCASDTGLALGAAAFLALSSGGDVAPAEDAFLGIDAMSDLDLLRRRGFAARRTTVDEIAHRLAQGAIIGRIAGRAEIGPRALGNRAILSTPAGVRIRDRINLLKGRESWRPLAPILTAASAQQVLTGPTDAYMLRTADLVDDPRMEAVRHVDGTTRAKIVQPHELGLAALMSAVAAESGLAAVLCTSFNGAGEPIVNSVIDALLTAQRLGLTALCGDDWILEL
ncbi:MAG: hypothetical protein HOV77_11410 [Hamadaea sp.]|uniref:carbamoyltransferase C-terminal domain-containing protein n=1 Tax=Hamadaea sp. TaxID=2024425 RepID=UPI0018497EB1|nr:carbamoyltransferase C-terminal domain-containing protein [Hamadaea sp.]NUT19787.1 hypothetical protein [Hamadaea sp.]